MRRWVAMLALWVALLLLPQVSAHAEPWTSEPADGDRLAEAPDRVTVTFNEPIHAEGSWIQVWDLSGNRVDLDDLVFEPGEHPILHVGLPPLPDGPYLVHWQTYSQVDGHTLRAAFGFSVGAVTPPAGIDTTDQVPFGAAMARALTYLGYTAAIGAFAFQWLVLRRPPQEQERVLIDGATMLGALLHFAGLVWLTVDTILRTGLGPLDFLASQGGLDLWSRLLLGLALLLLTALWWYGPVRPRTSVAIIAGLWILAVAVGARFGHGDSPTAWLVQTIHGVSIAAWIGALFLFLVLLIRADASKEEARRMQALGLRFSTLGIAAVTGMAITGLALSLLIVGASLFDPRVWTDGPWRSFLTLKVGLVLVMIGLATFNREVFLAREQQVGPLRRAFRQFADRRLRWQAITQRGGTSDFRNVVAVESIIGVAVLVCAGLLMSSGAPTALLPDDGNESFEATGAAGNFTILFEATPPPTEDHFSDVRIRIQHLDGTVVEGNTCSIGDRVQDDCIQLHWWRERLGPDHGVNSTGRPAPGGWWLFDEVGFTRGGVHVMELHVRTDDVELDVIQWTVSVRRG